MDFMQSHLWACRPHIYDSRRHPLLAGVREDTKELVEMGVPCQLIYDRRRGGRVDDDIVPRHPRSGGRSNAFPPPLELPDLRPPDGLPQIMDGRWLTNGAGGDMSPGALFKRDLNLRHSDIDLESGNLIICQRDQVPQEMPWVPSDLRARDLDGRREAMLVHQHWGDVRGRAAVSALLTRAVAPGAEGPGLTARISHLEHVGKHPPREATIQTAYVAALLIATDCQRQLLRLADRGDTSAAVSLNLELKEFPDFARPHFAQSLVSWLARSHIQWGTDPNRVSITGLDLPEFEHGLQIHISNWRKRLTRLPQSHEDIEQLVSRPSQGMGASN